MYKFFAYIPDISSFILTIYSHSSSLYYGNCCSLDS